jgi:serine/threonine-protein kinase 24/25/MST4
LKLEFISHERMLTVKLSDTKQLTRRLDKSSPSSMLVSSRLGTKQIADSVQIDLESSEDDILEIQQEISVLSTCASPFVTQYIASFLRGHKLWIVMEYLGGGSCLDLVWHHSRLSRTILI